jgi:cytochrome b561
VNTARESLQNRLHVAVALACAWLVLTSPWVSLLRRVPRDAGFFDYAHLVVGLLGLLLALAYAFACVRGGRWRAYFPWAAGDVAPLGRDLAGLVRGRLPSAEGGGLYAVIEGLLLLALLLVAITGAGWWLAQGDASALDWRTVHIVGARALTVLIVLHIVAVATHLVELA